MNNYERAVIEAARRTVRTNGTAEDYDNLSRAVDALDAHESAEGPTLDTLENEIGRMSGRAAACLHRARRSAHGWPESMTHARQLAGLHWSVIADVRNAGPAAWGIWANALRRSGIEPAWAERLGV